MPLDLAVVPVAGQGTRLLPSTKSQPKEMLPVGRKPVVQYVVEELAQSGVQRLLFITGPGKTIPQFRDQRVSPVAFSGGFGFHQDEEYEREVLKADLTKFLGNFELKRGHDGSWDRERCRSCQPPG